MGITLKNNKSVTKNMTIKGDDGVGIKTITSGTPVVTEEKTTTPITVTLTDETTQNFNVEAKNGSGGGTGGKKYFHQICIHIIPEDSILYFNLVTTTPKFNNAIDALDEVPNLSYISYAQRGIADALTNLPIVAHKSYSGEILTTSINLTTKEVSSSTLSMESLILLSDNSVEI